MHADFKEEEYPLHQEQTDDDKKTYCLTSIDRTEKKIKSLAIDIKGHESCKKQIKGRMLQKLKARSRQRTKPQRRKWKVSEKEKVSQTHKPVTLTIWKKTETHSTTAEGASIKSVAHEARDLRCRVTRTLSIM